MAISTAGRGQLEAEKRIREARAAGARSLDLKGLYLEFLPDALVHLHELQELNISLNCLTELPDSISRLTQLREVYARLNSIKEVPRSIGRLGNLRILDLSRNKLSALPRELCNIASLTLLDVSVNQLTEFPASIEQLVCLRELNASSNALTTIPPGMESLNSLSKLFLHNNPGLSLPPEALGSSHEDVWRRNALPSHPREILKFYFASRDSQPLNEAKMLLVGRGGVGKTSLVRRLVQNEFGPSEEKTKGIAIATYTVRIRDDEVRLNVWDFGGQEIMHATHQFFLTKRSLYLLVLNAREGEQDANIEYWLRLVESFGANSPVIVVINKIKDHFFDLNQKGLTDKFPAIRGFVQTDCSTNEGIEKLRELIVRETDRLDHLRDAFPKSWVSVKTHLANLNKNFIEYDQYRKLCLEQGIAEESDQQALLGFLNDLGVVVNFRDDARLRETHVLKPNWVTRGIYQILNSPQLAQRKNGQVNASDISNLLDANDYPVDKRRFLFDLMAKFELCYEFYDKEGEFLVPELLGKEERVSDSFETCDALRFEYRYNILPEGLVPRFIVRSRALNLDLNRWRTGAELSFEGNRALIKADIQDRKVSITIIGNLAGRVRLLEVIRSDFEWIHSSIAKLNATEMVPITGYPGMVIPYNKLEKLKSAGHTNFTEVWGEEIIVLNAQALLSELEESPKHSERPDLHTRPVQVVYSYAHADERLRDQLETQLKILQRSGLISTWHDRKIMPGVKYAKVIDEAFKSADLILALVSASFLASDYAMEIEMKTALERHKKGEAVVIPIIIRECLFQESAFGALLALPKDAKAIMSWRNKDKAWLNVADGIATAAKSIRETLLGASSKKL